MTDSKKICTFLCVGSKYKKKSVCTFAWTVMWTKRYMMNILVFKSEIKFGAKWNKLNSLDKHCPIQ